jgi:hypothetical protein
MRTMKKNQNRILSVIIFSFIFLVLHDYAMLKIDPHNHPSILSTDIELVNISAQKSPDLADDIHKSIHTLVAINTQNTARFFDIILQPNPNCTIIGMSSNNHYVLERPPLI